MKRSIFACAAAVAVLLGASHGAWAQHQGQGHNHGHGDHHAAQADAATLPRCPVMGGKINFLVSTETDEGPVYFCCASCISKYKAEPAVFADKVKAQREVLADRPKVQTVCPVSGKPVDSDVSTEHDGEKVYFCCKGCIAKYQAEPQKYRKALAHSYTYQTKCPVMGGEIDPQAFVRVAGGKKIYFCCQGCEDQLFAEPDKYLPKLADQGVSISADDMKHGENEASAGAPSDGHDSHDRDHHH